MKRNIRVLLIVLVVLALAGGTFAFAAANSVPQSNVGYGESIISGYTVTNIIYAPATDMNEINGVSFFLNKPATTVKIDTGDAEWTSWSCEPTLTFNTETHLAIGTIVSCTGSKSTVAVTALNVYASDNLETQATYQP